MKEIENKESNEKKIIVLNKNSNIEKSGEELLLKKKDNINKNTIKILTYNFFLRPPPIKTNKDDYKTERLEDFFKFLPSFDIICFQEVFCTFSNRKHRMIREGGKNGFYFYLLSKVPSFFSRYPCDGGLLLLSKYPIEEHDYFPYYLNISGDSGCSKGVIYAKIKIDNSYLFLFMTHLQASYFDESLGSYLNTCTVRMKQIEELINFIYNKLLIIPKNEVEEGTVILAGDFNIDAHDNKFAKEKFPLPNFKVTEYEIFKQKLKKLGSAIDLMLKKYNEHLYTFGDNEKEEYDHVLTGKADINSRQTIDYIWEIIPDYNLDIYKQKIEKKNNISFPIDNSKKEKKLKVAYDSFEVEKFLVKERPYQQLSDHFGLSVEISK